MSPVAVQVDERDSSPPGVTDSPWVEMQTQGRRPPLYLVHGVGGGMLWGYANLARYLGPDQPVYALKAGAPRRSGGFETIEEMAAGYVDELRRLQPKGPYALGGYCFGGNVAYAMARVLAAQGQGVSLLVLLNASPPNSSYDKQSWSPVYLFKFLRNLCHWLNGFRQWGPAKQRRFLSWKMSGLRGKILGNVWDVSGGPRGLNVDELVDLSDVPLSQRQTWDAHVRALSCHRTQPYDGRVVLLRTRGHPLNCSYDGTCGWGDLARGGVAVHIIPGLHDSLLEEPYVRDLARELKRHLDTI